MGRLKGDLRGWFVRTQPSVSRMPLNRQIATAQEQFDDLVFEHAMTQAVRQVKDKDA